MKLLFDSTVAVDYFRTGEPFTLFRPGVARSQVYLSSVVAMELRMGCRTKVEVRTVEQFLRIFQATGRVVSSNHKVWLRAAVILADLGVQHGLNLQRRRRMGNDALIAASAADVGAAVITKNDADFALIARCVPLVWFRSIEGFLGAVPEP